MRVSLLKVFFAFLGLFIWSSSSMAQNTNTPDGLVKFVVEDVMAVIKNDKAIQSGDFRKINALVDQKILPYSDFQKTTQLSMGKNWSKASAQQQAQITQEFKIGRAHV